MQKIIWILSLLVLCPSIALAQGESACDLRITFVDVGEGDATVVEIRGSTPIIIDSGNPKSIGRLIDYLESRSLTLIAALFLTHPHLDHIGGVFELLDRMDVTNVYDNGQPLAEEEKSNDLYRWYRELVRDEGKEKYREIRAPTKLNYADLNVEVLNPGSIKLDSDWNNNSLVLLLTYGKFRALFMGDALSKTETDFVRSKIYLSASILKAGHHGSKGTGSEEFLKLVGQKLTIVSVNRANIRGYPDKEVLSRYGKFGKVLRTDKEGNIVVCASHDGNFSVIK